jgi:pimeloyl-ACP methyl ester carboxylesterase
LWLIENIIILQAKERQPDIYTEDLKAFCFPGTRCSSHRLRLNSGTELGYHLFRPVITTTRLPLIILPGLVSVLENFRYLLNGFTEKYVVYYLETAEKKSAVVDRNYAFTIESFSRDLADYIHLLGFQSRNYILVGYSMGAAVVLDSFRFLENKPSFMVLGEPTAEFGFPWWSRLLARFTVPVFPYIKPAVLWYIRNFRINTNEDEEMYHITQRALDSADPQRLCSTLLAISPYQVWEHLPGITVPVLILGVSMDSFHSYKETLLLSEKLGNCSLIDMENNVRNHSVEVVLQVEKFADFVS